MDHFDRCDDAERDWATRAIATVANRHANGRVVSSLEGGYDLEGLGRSAVAHVTALGED
jgi:acetoin utilization deacetylase AcuC-like enzyme